MVEAKRELLDRQIGAAWRQAAALPLWDDPVEPSDLRGGLSNVNFVVEDAGRKFVVRIGGDNEAHGVVRKNELAASRAAHAAGVAPRVAYAEPGVLVLDFIEGRTLTPASSSFCSTAVRWRGSQPATITSPPVRAAAMAKVPASMRSGMMR